MDRVDLGGALARRGDDAEALARRQLRTERSSPAVHTAKSCAAGTLIVARRIGHVALGARAWGALGARSVHIWSNTVLAPAIALYKTLGFVECEMGEGEVFERANIRLLALPPPPPPAGAAAGASSGGAAAIGAPPR